MAVHKQVRDVTDGVGVAATHDCNGVCELTYSWLRLQKDVASLTGWCCVYVGLLGGAVCTSLHQVVHFVRGACVCGTEAMFAGVFGRCLSRQFSAE